MCITSASVMETHTPAPFPRTKNVKCNVGTTQPVSRNIHWRQITENTKIGVYFNKTKVGNKIVNEKHKTIVCGSIKSMVRMQGPLLKANSLAFNLLRWGQSSILCPFTTHRLLHCHCKASGGAEGRNKRSAQTPFCSLSLCEWNVAIIQFNS